MAKLIAARFAQSASDVTRGVGADPHIPENLDDLCRIAADEYIGRRAEEIAHFSGLSARSINQERERVPDRRSTLDRLTRLVSGGMRSGRTFEEVSRFLRPTLDVLGADAAPRVAILGTVGVSAAAAVCIREVNDAIASAIESIRDGRLTLTEAAEIEKQAQQGIESLHRLRREAQAASGKP